MERDSPAISGTLTQDGRPVGGATVEVKSKFFDDVKSAQTDDGGKFELDPIKDFEFFITMGDHIFDYTVSIKVNGQDYLGFEGYAVGYMYENLALQCDLAKPVQNSDKNEYCVETNLKQMKQ